ncbi:MAG: nickel pincer cofactor biosynthesis protein LarC [Spirochaetales bacterium]|nr:nickel pincer cofactor biosynthesis protein LarC [Spirochaetales bacterium]
MKTLHFECFAGISGDMTLGALVDLGVDPAFLKGELTKLGLSGWDLSFVRAERNGITGMRALVKLSESTPRLITKTEHSHHSWREIRQLIERSTLSDSTKGLALRIFERIAIAEAHVHGKNVEEVGFHEVGALDSIIDIVGAAVCLEALAPERVTASEIELGGGTVTCAHGVLPVPAPATLLLCQGLPVRTGGFDKEMTTPTGAAILAEIVDEFVTVDRFIERKTGYGLGTRKLSKPNVLRVSWRETLTPSADPWLTEELILLHTNIDDMTGEALGFLMEELLACGARDVTMTPCTMKKSRPGIIVEVLADAQHLDLLRRTLFQQSTTLGFRETRVSRVSLSRQETSWSGKWGQAHLKTATLENNTKSKLEYEDRARVAREQKISLTEAENLLLGDHLSSDNHE